jgi:ubiquinone/menaquinone biosynthesis C-methylase UbiE
MESQGSEGVKEAVRAQFGRTAAAYAASALHARGADLDRLVEMLALRGDEHVLDVGTATGHTALRLAPRVARVVGVDMTPPMLAMARALAAERGIANAVFVEGDAEALPFADASFDVVTCRVCAHHFPHVARAVAEMARVTRPGGQVAVVDNYAPEDGEQDQFINTLETVRDPSHVREYTLAEWRAFFVRAGLELAGEDLGEMQIEVPDWVERAQTPPEAVATVYSMLAGAPPSVRAAFSIESAAAARFRLKRVIMLGRRAGGA